MSLLNWMNVIASPCVSSCRQAQVFPGSSELIGNVAGRARENRRRRLR